jgi:hypothetical protein
MRVGALWPRDGDWGGDSMESGDRRIVFSRKIELAAGLSRRGPAWRGATRAKARWIGERLYVKLDCYLACTETL